jgi:cytoskeleton protein RodZ
MTDIGASLREARMRQRIDIIEVEQATKIRTKYLRAMEDEEWSVLPGPTFAKSFLRTYADYLGLDSRLLVEEWKRRYERPDEEAFPPAGRAGRSARGAGGARGAAQAPGPPGGGFRRFLPATIAAVVVVVVFAALFAIGSNNSNPSTPTATGPRAATHHRHHQRRHKPAPPRRVRLSVVPTGAVYICLVDDTGRKLIPGLTLQAGAAPRSFSAKRFLLNLGNASVELTANGKRIPVAPSPTAIGLEITPAGHKPLPTGRRPTCT